MKIKFDADMLAKYDTYGPRYTSYPTAVKFNDSFDETAYRQELEQSNHNNKPLSLYFHIPFCVSLCYYCACSKIITRKYEQTGRYVEHMETEIQRQAELIDDSKTVTQLHFGGGTPTYLNDDQLAELMHAIGDNFNLAPAGEREFSIEIDPRAVRETTIPMLYELGFNRISFGVQDFDPKVQQAVNRMQSVEQTFAVIDSARESGYQSINVDLIYGLPFQTAESFSRTLDTMLIKRPERLAVYSYAHMPHRVRAQKLINSEDIPAPETKLAILEMTIERLQEAGYVYIGMDHFALPNDELALAKADGTLQRNFQGYSVQADSDLIGMGMTSIGKINDSFSQNQHRRNDYYKALDAGSLAISRGYKLTRDDIIRRDVIQSLMCQTMVSFSEIGKRHDIDFYDYFHNELKALVPMTRDGLVSLDKDEVRITSAGQLLLRNVAMKFDAYLNPTVNVQQFSKVI